MEKQFDRSIYFDISTFENLRLQGQLLTDVLNNIIRDLILPLERPLVIYTDKFNGQKKHYRFTDSNWNEICRFLGAGEIKFLLLSHDDDSFEQPNYYNSAVSLSLSCDYEQDSRNMGLTFPVADNIALSVSERLFQGVIPYDYQEKFVNSFKKTFEELNGITGFLTFEKKNAMVSPNSTALEDLLDFMYVVHSKKFDVLARGYFWGNIFSEGHIRNLGGKENILQNAPCEKIEIIGPINRQAVYLQLTPDVNNYSDNQLRELKKFLSPVLPKEVLMRIKEHSYFQSAMQYSRLVFDQ